MDRVQPIDTDVSPDAGLCDEDEIEQVDYFNDGCTLQQLLEKHLAAAKRTLMSNHRSIMQRVSQTIDALTRMEAENAELHMENHSLREKLSAAGLLEASNRSETGGTGESSCTKSMQERWAFSPAVPPIPAPTTPPPPAPVHNPCLCDLSPTGIAPRLFVQGSPSAAAELSGALPCVSSLNWSSSPAVGSSARAGLSVKQTPAKSTRLPPLNVASGQDHMAELPGRVGNSFGADGVAGTAAGGNSFSSACNAGFGGSRSSGCGFVVSRYGPAEGIASEGSSGKRRSTVDTLFGIMPQGGCRLARAHTEGADAGSMGTSFMATNPDARVTPATGSRGNVLKRSCSWSGFESDSAIYPGRRVSVAGQPHDDPEDTLMLEHEQKPLRQRNHQALAKLRTTCFMPNQGMFYEEQDEVSNNRRIAPPKAVFADAAAMKEKLRLAIGKPEYNVADFYHEHGFWQGVARSVLFENVTLAVIGINAMWIAVDTDFNEADVLVEADLIYQVAENLFCIYFAFEWFVRFMAFKRKRDGLRDAWFVFDSALVAMMVLETWVFSLFVLIGGGSSGGGVGNAGVLKLFRLVRLSRMARMARLLRAMPELMVMIKGMASAMRSVFFTLCLLGCIVYLFAIAFVQLMGPRGALEQTKVGNELFPDVLTAMNNLLLGGTMPDSADLVNDVGEAHPVMRLLILMFILLASLTVMNMLVGVLCEVVCVVSAVEKEQLLVNFVKTQLMHLLSSIGFDEAGNAKISKDDFRTLLEKPEAARTLTEVGVDVIGLVDLTDFIFKDDDGLSFPEFMDVVLQLRGSNTATVKDIVDLRKLVVGEIGKLTERAQRELKSEIEYCSH